MKNYLLLAGTFLLLSTIGCTAVPRASAERAAATSTPTTTAPGATAPSDRFAQPIETARVAGVENELKPGNTKPSVPGDGASAQKSAAPPEEVAVLVVQAGALITQVNGDTKLRCLRPDCRIPLPPGMHRVAVGYRDTANRSGSTVTYTSMYPRIVEITLEPGHRYSVTASGRYSQQWWIAIEDQTANKTVYDDRKKPE